MTRALIDLSIAPLGGARTYARSFLRATIELHSRGELPLTPVVMVGRQAHESDFEPLIDACASAGIETVLTSLSAGTWNARLRREVALEQARRHTRADVTFVPRDIAPLSLRKPYVTLVHNMFAWERHDRISVAGGQATAALMRRLAWLSAVRANEVIAVSHHMRERLPARVPATVIYHGCELGEGVSPRTYELEYPLDIVAIGNLEKHKRFERIIEHVAELRRVGVSANLEIYGPARDIAYRQRLGVLGKSLLGHDPYGGVLDHAQLELRLRQAHLLAVGTTFESFCMPIVEAMACGAVPWSPESALVSEICRGAAVTYPSTWPARDVARGLISMIPNLSDVSRAGLRRARDFNWRTTVLQTSEVLLRAATSGPTGSTR